MLCSQTDERIGWGEGTAAALRPQQPLDGHW